MKTFRKHRKCKRCKNTLRKRGNNISTRRRRINYYSEMY